MSALPVKLRKRKIQLHIRPGQSIKIRHDDASVRRKQIIVARSLRQKRIRQDLPEMVAGQEHVKNAALPIRRVDRAGKGIILRLACEGALHNVRRKPDTLPLPLKHLLLILLSVPLQVCKALAVNIRLASKA